MEDWLDPTTLQPDPAVPGPSSAPSAPAGSSQEPDVEMLTETGEDAQAEEGGGGSGSGVGLPPGLLPPLSSAPPALP